MQPLIISIFKVKPLSCAMIITINLNSLLNLFSLWLEDTLWCLMSFTHETLPLHFPGNGVMRTGRVLQCDKRGHLLRCWSEHNGVTSHSTSPPQSPFPAPRRSASIRLGKEERTRGNFREEKARTASLLQNLPTPSPNQCKGEALSRGRDTG